MSYYEYHVARKYVQFENALQEIAKYSAFVGRKILFLTACGSSYDEIVTTIKHSFHTTCEEQANSSLAEKSPRYAGYVPLYHRLDGQIREMSFEFYNIENLTVCAKNIHEISLYAQANGFDTVAGVGGGRALDFARAVTHYLPLHVILIPTLCATNASISTLSVIYSEDGSKILEYWRMDQAPDLVLADTKILLSNGPRVFAGGIGDILSTYLEATCNVELAGYEDEFSRLSVEGVRMATALIMKEAPTAIADVQERKLSPSVETVLSMILHNNGPLWSICTLGLAHVIDEIFLFFDASHRIPHGLRVGYAAQLMLRYQRVSEKVIDEYVAFCKTVGIPASMKELNLADIPAREWEKAIQQTVEISGTLASLPFQISSRELLDLIISNGGGVS